MRLTDFPRVCNNRPHLYIPMTLNWLWLLIVTGSNPLSATFEDDLRTRRCDLHASRMNPSYYRSAYSVNFFFQRVKLEFLFPLSLSRLRRCDPFVSVYLLRKIRSPKIPSFIYLRYTDFFSSKIFLGRFFLFHGHGRFKNNFLHNSRRLVSSRCV